MSLIKQMRVKMSELTKEEIEILIYDKYPFEPISVYESPFGEKQYPPTKYIVPKPKFKPDTRHEYYYEYYRPFVSVFFMKKAIETLEATGSLDEMKDRKYNKYYLNIEAEKEGLGGAALEHLLSLAKKPQIEPNKRHRNDVRSWNLKSLISASSRALFPRLGKAISNLIFNP